MEKETSRENLSEMERIHRGLEAFLEKEVYEGYEAESDAGPEHTQQNGYEECEYDEYECDEHEYGEYEDEESVRTVMARQSANKPATRQGASASRAGAGKSGRKKQPAKKKKHKGIKRFLTIVVVLLLAVTALWYVTVSKLYDKMEYVPTEILADEPMKEDGVTNILLIGNDSRAGGEDGRSDAMILVSISNRTKTIYMTSLLRDIYVEIPGHESNRLNAAYAFGGPELLLETIKQNLDIEVNRYVQVNFQAFANLIDAVGGVELELTNEEVQLVNAYLNEYNMLENRPIDTDYLPVDASGLLHLNGPQALAYSRNRYIGSDFGRTERQRKILEAVFHQLPSSMLTNSGDMIDGILPNLTTNISKSECYTLSLDAPKLLTYEIVQASIPIEGSYQNATIRKMSVLQVDFEKNKEFIRTHIYGEQEGE
ncbi:MAG: LCP family protein [Lachnospiraceae bacterium]|nr:LCP family protein [Lachnospiraceae bacterium]